jgi:hypothetical protein
MASIADMVPKFKGPCECGRGQVPANMNICMLCLRELAAAYMALCAS